MGVEPDKGLTQQCGPHVCRLLPSMHSKCHDVHSTVPFYAKSCPSCNSASPRCAARWLVVPKLHTVRLTIVDCLQGSRLCTLCPYNMTNLQDGSTTCTSPIVPGTNLRLRYAVIVSFGVLLNGTDLDDIASKVGPES